MGTPDLMAIAKEVVEASFQEIVLWATNSPVVYGHYHRLLRSIAISYLAKSILPDNVKELIALQPFWGGNPNLDALRANVERMATDPELLRLQTEITKKVMEQHD